MKVQEAIEILASDEGMADPAGAMASFDEEIRTLLESGTAQDIRDALAAEGTKPKAFQIKMRLGPPGSLT